MQNQANWGGDSGLWGRGGEGRGVGRVSAHLVGFCWVHACAQTPSWVQGHDGAHTQAGPCSHVNGSPGQRAIKETYNKYIITGCDECSVLREA